MTVDEALEVARASLKNAPAVNYMYLKYKDADGQWLRFAEVSRAGVTILQEYIMDYLDDNANIVLEASEYKQNEWNKPVKGHIL